MLGGGERMRWYVNQNGKTAGPYSEQRIAMLATWRKISRDAYICDEQLSTWVAISRTAFAPLVADAPASAPSRPCVETPLATSVATNGGDAARPLFAGQQRHAWIAAAVLIVAAFMFTFSV